MESHEMGTYRALMVDMYPSYPLMDGKHDDESFMEDYIFFDDDSSYSINSETGGVYGGMRYRTAGANLEMDKYVIFHPGRGCIPLSGHNMTGVHNEEEKRSGESCGTISFCRQIVKNTLVFQLKRNRAIVVLSR